MQQNFQGCCSIVVNSGFDVITDISYKILPIGGDSLNKPLLYLRNQFLIRTKKNYYIIWEKS